MKRQKGKKTTGGGKISLILLTLCIAFGFTTVKANAMTIYVRVRMETVTDDQFQIDVEPSDTIGEVKQKIQDEKGYPLGTQRLILVNKLLDDSKTIADYNIQQGTYIFLVIQKVHNYSEEWSMDDKTHWHACKDEGCDTKADEADHADNDKDHKCDVCGKTLSECVDNNKDHKCDVCGETLSECADNDKDHKCDVCGKVLSECADNDKDHKCDVCGKTLSECADNDKDHKCDVCGKTLSVHVGGVATCWGKAKCEICGESYGEVDPQNHTALKHIEAKAATKNEDGNIEYWYCSECGKYYKDAAGTQEINKKDIVKVKLSTGTDTNAKNMKADNGTSDNSQSPKTGDTSELMLWTMLLFLCGGVAFNRMINIRKKQANRK